MGSDIQSTMTSPVHEIFGKVSKVTGNFRIVRKPIGCDFMLWIGISQFYLFICFLCPRLKKEIDFKAHMHSHLQKITFMSPGIISVTY